MFVVVLWCTENQQFVYGSYMSQKSLQQLSEERTKHVDSVPDKLALLSVAGIDLPLDAEDDRNEFNGGNQEGLSRKRFEWTAIVAAEVEYLRLATALLPQSIQVFDWATGKRVSYPLEQAKWELAGFETSPQQPLLEKLKQCAKQICHRN